MREQKHAPDRAVIESTLWELANAIREVSSSDETRPSRSSSR